MIALLFFGSVYALEAINSTIWFRPWFREILGDYAYPVCMILPLNVLKLTIRQIATIFWTGFSHIPGTLKRANIQTLPHTRAFYPTIDRGWFVGFDLPVKWVFTAMPIGFLLMLLFYFDHVIKTPHLLFIRVLIQIWIACQQYYSSGKAISSQKAWRFPLGLFPVRMYQFHSWHYWASTTERSRTASK